MIQICFKTNVLKFLWSGNNLIKAKLLDTKTCGKKLNVPTTSFLLDSYLLSGFGFASTVIKFHIISEYLSYTCVQNENIKLF